MWKPVSSKRMNTWDQTYKTHVHMLCVDVYTVQFTQLLGERKLKGGPRASGLMDLEVVDE